jgi:hypothetical protein
VGGAPGGGKSGALVVDAKRLPEGSKARPVKQSGLPEARHGHGEQTRDHEYEVSRWGTSLDSKLRYVDVR